MKNIFYSLIALLMAISPTLLVAETAKVGKKAPDFSVKDINGKEQKLSAYAGKYVVLEWFNPGCPFVKKHYDSGNMQRLQKQLTSEDVVWLTINSSGPGRQGYLEVPEAQALVKSMGINSSALILDSNGKIGLQYDATTTPDMYLISPDGTLVYSGAIDDMPSTDAEDIAKSKNLVLEAYNQSKAGKPVTMASTEPYGCSVKYGADS